MLSDPFLQRPAVALFTARPPALPRAAQGLSREWVAALWNRSARGVAASQPALDLAWS